MLHLYWSTWVFDMQGPILKYSAYEVASKSQVEPFACAHMHSVSAISSAVKNTRLGVAIANLLRSCHLKTQL